MDSYDIQDMINDKYQLNNLSFQFLNYKFELFPLTNHICKQATNEKIYECINNTEGLDERHLIKLIQLHAYNRHKKYLDWLIMEFDSDEMEIISHYCCVSDIQLTTDFINDLKNEMSEEFTCYDESKIKQSLQKDFMYEKIKDQIIYLFNQTGFNYHKF